jgi:hypothetical protein
MKAKKHPSRSNHQSSREEILPHELGTHLFAMIKRNLLARRRPSSEEAADQMTFAF